jgi:hypothetical protein
LVLLLPPPPPPPLLLLPPPPNALLILEKRSLALVALPLAGLDCGVGDDGCSEGPHVDLSEFDSVRAKGNGKLPGIEVF